MGLRSAITDARKVWEIPQDDVVAGILDPAFSASKTVNIMAGFYSSGAIRELAYGLSHLMCSTSGKLNIVCSQYIDKDDIPDTEIELVNTVIESLFLNRETTRDALATYTRECISYLCRKNRIEIKIAVSRRGLFHKKVYLFEDDEDGLVISGSANFSVGGFKRNHETIIVGKTWDSDHTVRELFDTQRSSFERLWNNEESNIDVYTISEAQRNRIIEYRQDTSIPTVPGEICAEGFSEKSCKENVFGIPEALAWRDGRYRHQGEAVIAWEEAGRKGLLSIATGGGKTITALISAYRLYKEKGRLHILIIVPTKVLAEQWKHECKKFGLVQTEYQGSKSVRERIEQIQENISSIEYGLDTVMVSIVMSGTIGNVFFQRTIANARIEQLIIGDECHNLGTERILAALPPTIKYRLGLSATPIRQYDVQGSAGIKDYFGETIYNFDIGRAIGVCLVPYNYYIHICWLDDQEASTVAEITRKIRILLGRNSDGEENTVSEEVKMLQIRRARIIESAKSKLDELQAVLERLSGVEKERSIFFCTSKQKEQINAVQQILAENRIKFRRVTQAESADRYTLETIIDDFRSGKIEALVAKKVLDEGANIPEVENAFFLGSSTTEREWIQRRGRVLRSCPGKESATIHDFVCLPTAEHAEECKSVVRRELTRCLEFSEYSANRFDQDGGRMVLESLRSEYGI